MRRSNRRSEKRTALSYRDTRLAVFVDATLKAETDFELSIGLTFIGEMGYFRYLGEGWDKYGFWGAIKSVKVPSLSAPAKWVEKPKCTGKSLDERGKSAAGLFTCDTEVALTTPDLRRVLWFHPTPAFGAEGVHTFERIVDSGATGGKPIVVFCAEGKYDERVALAVAHDGVRGYSRDVSSQPKYAKACKVRPANLAQFEEPDRWGGTIGDGSKAEDKKNRWGGSIGGGSDGKDVTSPFDEHQFLPGFVDRFCRGKVSDTDLNTLERLAHSRAVSAKALVAIFNLYGAFYAYEFKSERWLNDLYYGSGVSHLPASCRPMIRKYRSARDIPMHFGKARDRVNSIWSAVK